MYVLFMIASANGLPSLQNLIVSEIAVRRDLHKCHV